MSAVEGVIARPRTVAELVAEFLTARGIGRVFGLQGGHIQPVWDQLTQRGIDIVDVRDEGAAVHMAHAHALLTGQLGVALATAGPGVTNCVTAIANALLERAPVLLIGGCPPRPQEGRGPLQGIPQVEIMRPITRLSRCARVAESALAELDAAASVALGESSAPGSVYLEFPTDVLRESVHPNLVLAEHLRPKPAAVLPPDPSHLARALEMIAAAAQPVVISGRGAAGAGSALVRLLDATGALYLDTQESRGLVPSDHPSVVGAVRSRAMREADLVILVGRKLDYQLGYGSPVVFPKARFIRIASCVEELRDNRRGEVEILASPAPALAALAADASSTIDREWARSLRDEHRIRASEYAANLSRAPSGSDGRMHPNRIFAALREVLRSDAIGIADGGDLLSFARTGLEVRTYLDSGAFGCLGVGVPFAIAAALAEPGRQVVAICGDGAFGINAMEVDTARRHNAGAVFIVANNGAWNIERYDQEVNYAGRVAGTTLDFSDYSLMARAFGLHAERVEDPDRLVAALEAAFARAPALLDVVVTREAVSSDSDKGLSRVPDHQPLTAWDEAEQARRR